MQLHYVFTSSLQSCVIPFTMFFNLGTVPVRFVGLSKRQSLIFLNILPWKSSLINTKHVLKYIKF